MTKIRISKLIAFLALLGLAGALLTGCGLFGLFKDKNAALYGRWESGADFDADSNFPTVIEIYEGGTGVCWGIKVIWKTERDAIIFSTLLADTTFRYEVSKDNVLTLRNRDGSKNYRKTEIITETEPQQTRATRRTAAQETEGAELEE
ncbi:MAG: hypothetical protein FWG90_12835 [Oscillospiraceae bacterium]|nr:hypothetical protein [Oscillospiraceae bacterium]